MSDAVVTLVAVLALGQGVSATVVVVLWRRVAHLEGVIAGLQGSPTKTKPAASPKGEPHGATV